MASPSVTHRLNDNNPSSSKDPKQSLHPHSRVYQACVPCRRRKVRCDLGPVDAPHEPPCVRCRRETKECFFSATRRKRKTGTDDGEGYPDDLDDDFVARNARQRTAYAAASPDTHLPPFPSRKRSIDSVTSPNSSAFNHRPSEKYGNAQASSPYYVGTKTATQAASHGQEVANETAAALLKAPINTPGDALHLLLEASGRTESFQHDDSSLQAQRSTPASSSTYAFGPVRPRSRQQRGQNIDPAIAADHRQAQAQPDTPEIVDAINSWSRLRFVRAGWFTAQEAISYIEYYYENLAPLTPIAPPDFHSPSTHPGFLNDEPLLVVTVLTIASRYMELSGPGAESRSYMVHERLWNYLQNMITRMFWGQEQFGGGFCRSGSWRIRSTVQGGLRALGTIESLLLLSEFHPRSMHFPPGDDGDDIVLTVDDGSPSRTPTNTPPEAPSIGKTTVAGWSEPALRSDRMCWSLIGMSYTLAFELGVFGNFQTGFRHPQSPGASGDRSIPLSSEEQRVNRVERLLYIYINSASGRFGIPSMFARQDEDLEPLHIQTRMAIRSEPQDPIDNIQECWMDMTMIMKACNTSLFPSNDHAQAMIETGGYVSILEQLQPLMECFGQKLGAVKMSRYPWIILSIELEYVKMYVYSLALQAVLRYWTSNAGPGNEENTSRITFSTIYKRNAAYIRELVEAARNLLKLVVDGLLPGNYLKHAPVRTHFRILSGAMFLLKTFAVGATEDEVGISLQLLDRTVKALRTSVVDDVHLSLRIADLLEAITSSIRHKFVRLPARTSNSNRATPPKTAYASPSHATHLHNNSNFIPPNDSFQPYSTDGQVSTASVPTNAMNTFDSSNISIMPPPNSGYLYSPSLYAANNHVELSSPFDTNEEDWLTLNLNSLLSSDLTGFQTGVGNDGQWFGNFGPEINGNLEVLGKLTES